ncbi:MAG: hypothetical protein ABIE94_04580, partial [archaeon]
WSVNCTDINGNENSSETRELYVDTTGPVSVLDRPLDNANLVGDTYTANASVTDAGPAVVDWVVFEYRYNASDSWKSACNDTDGTPYECTWNISALAGGNDYQVRVRANDTFSNFGAYDTHVNITIDKLAPTAFNLSTPENGTVSNDLTPLLNWTETTEENFLNYTVQADDSSLFTSIDYTYSTSDIAITTYQVTAAWTTNTLWYWRVRAFDIAGLNYTTGYFIYETDTLAPIVILISPPNGDTDPDGDVNFFYTVTDSALDYCELYTNLSGWGVEDTENNPSNGLNSFQVNSIAVNTTFHWNVKCYDNFSYNSFYSENWTITIGAATPYQNVTIPSNVTVNNSAPIVSNVVMSSPINLLAGTTKELNCTGQVSDDNGASDINTTTATLYHLSVAPGSPDSNETHYSSTCSCAQVDNLTNNCTCIFNMWYYADPGTWYCNITAVDIDEAQDSYIFPVTVNALRAINITPTFLDYGDLVYGNISEDLNVSLINLGNTIIDVSAFAYGAAQNDGLAMSCEAGNISASYERYSHGSGTLYGSMTSVSGNSAAPSLINLNISKRADEDVMSDASEYVYWKLQIPAGAFGLCNGTLTFIAEADS